MCSLQAALGLKSFQGMSVLGSNYTHPSTRKSTTEQLQTESLIGMTKWTWIGNVVTRPLKLAVIEVQIAYERKHHSSPRPGHILEGIHDPLPDILQELLCQDRFGERKQDLIIAARAFQPSSIQGFLLLLPIYRLFHLL